MLSKYPYIPLRNVGLPCGELWSVNRVDSYRYTRGSPICSPVLLPVRSRSAEGWFTTIFGLTKSTREVPWDSVPCGWERGRERDTLGEGALVGMVVGRTSGAFECWDVDEGRRLRGNAQLQFFWNHCSIDECFCEDMAMRPDLQKAMVLVLFIEQASLKAVLGT